MKKQNTNQEFFTAFWKLYEIKPIERISVNQLCKSAGYNRSTFYNHFVDIYDLQSKAVDNTLQPIKSRILSLSDFRVFLQQNTAEAILLPFFLQKSKYIELLFKRHDDYLLKEKIKENFILNIKTQLKGNAVDFDTIEILLEYQISAAMGAINYWYQNEKTIPAQDMVNKIIKISLAGAWQTLKTELDKGYEKIT